MSRTSKGLVAWLGVMVAGLGYLQLLPASAELLSSQPLRAVLPQAAHAQAPTSASGQSPDPNRALVNRYCVGCHNARLNRAPDQRLRLDTMDLAHVGENAELWEKVVRKLRAASMPPAGSPRPDKAMYDGFASWLETELDRAAAARPNPGGRVVHRLNRVEYTNAIRDLLALEIDGASMLPTDESGYGFDNIADVLSVTPGLLERYMFAAQKVSRLAIGDKTVRPATETFKIRAWPTLVQDERMSDELPFRSRGGAAITHHFPLDGEYALKITLQRDFANNGIMGIDNSERIDVRLDGKRIRLFNVGGECVGSAEPRCIAPPGVQMNNEYEMTADEPLRVRFQATAGPHLLGIAFIERTAAASEGVARVTGSNEMAIVSVELQGPFNGQGTAESPSHQRIFVCRPAERRNEEVCAKNILGTLARRAYRRPITGSEVQTLLEFYRGGRGEGGFENGIQFALERLLVSPSFLLRIERDPANVKPGVPYRISDLELASRLSFFVWSSIPDDELLDVAARSKLRDLNVLEQQVRRMLADPRATQSLVNNFAAQWLMLRDLRSLHPNPEVFPEFNDNLRHAFLRETELFLESQFREDRGVPELLTANYTFVNERLARFYGIHNVYGPHFRRVTLPKETNRGGLLGQGSILTLTSYPNRTSPVVRGLYVLKNILGSPPPPPPPNIPALKETVKGGVPATMRERMAQHRTDAICASCHSRMDPMGFALENFDGIGQYRTHDGKAPIDASGAFPDGATFEGPSEFFGLLKNQREQFVGTFTEKLLTYALGRGVEYYDMPAVRQIMRKAAPSDYRWSSVILGIVQSTPFQMRAAHQAEERERDGGAIVSNNRGVIAQAVRGR